MNLRLKTGLIYGLITSILSILIGFALLQAGLADFNNNSNFVVNLLILGLGFYLASEYFKKNNGGFMSYGDCMVTALWMGFFLGLISGIYAWAYMNLDPTLMEKTKNMIEAKMEEQGQSEEATEMALSMMETFSKPEILIPISIFFNLLLAALVGAVIGNFLKREKPLF